MSDSPTGTAETDDTGDDTERRNALAARRINDCLESGRETIDLSGLGLSKIPGAILKPLDQLVRTPFSDLTRPPSEDEFTTLTPSIQLFLYTNRLASLPPELFFLNNITVLSLRNNELEDLPPCISRLTRLKELNVAGNQLQFVPWEVLTMLRDFEESNKIRLRPNPFHTVSLKPTSSAPGSQGGGFDQRQESDTILPDTLRHNLSLGRQALAANATHSTGTRDHLIYLASAKIRYLDFQGRTIQPLSSVGTASAKDWATPLMHHPSPPPSRKSTSAPSLFELCLRRVQQYFTAQELRADDLDLPSPVHSALSAAANGIEVGSEKCSTCGKAFVIARAEWLEFWFHGQSTRPLTEDSILPVMRKTCSWACAQRTEVGTGWELS